MNHEAEVACVRVCVKSERIYTVHERRKGGREGGRDGRENVEG